MKIHELGLRELSEAIKAKKIRSAEIAEALIQRHEEIDPRIQAVTWFDGDELRAKAHAVDHRIQDGEELGPLAGIPIAIKDIYDWAGVPTGGGIPNGRPWMPQQTAPVLQGLEEAGMILYGKTATTDRAFIDPCSTRNPWEFQHTPGGSSSGSAAGVSACLFPAAVGSQTAGSVIRPAAFCGVVGMTVSRDRLRPNRGVLPLAPSFDSVGFFTRSVEDAEFLLAAWCGDDGNGPEVAQVPQGPYERPLFLGFARRGFIEVTEDETAHKTIHAAKVLSDFGSIVHVLKIPESYDHFLECHRQIFAYEAARVHRIDYQRNPDGFSPHIRTLVEEGLEVTELEYFRGRKVLEHFRQDMEARITEVDAIILPAATGPAPLGLDSTGDPSCNAPWTAIGFPAITIPSGYTENGMPIGLQLIGRPHAEKHLVRVALQVEQILNTPKNAPTALSRVEI